MDTSVIVALLADEPEADAFGAKLADAPQRYISGLVILEAVMRLSSLLKVDPVVAERRIQQVIDEAVVLIMPIDGAIST